MRAGRLAKTLARNRPLLVEVLRGSARGVAERRAELRHHVLRDAWTVVKRFGAQGVVNIESARSPA